MSMFSVGLSGLNAAQSALNTTSNNISNVYTPGYNREITKLGEGFASTGGVQVNDIERQFNQYVAAQLNSAKTQSSALSTYYNQVSQIDNLLADREAGLAPLMQNFFSSLEDLASAPSDPAARQGVLGTANTLSAQFRSFDGYLQDMQTNINNQIKDEITQVNNTTEQIAGLNREIALARARTGEAPNSLLNQRDQLVSELNERMDLRLNIQDGKTYNISLPNGQPLVTGADSFKLEAMESPSDPQRIVVGYRDGGGNPSALNEKVISGGALGGLMSFRSETLDKTQNQIGQLAVSLSVAFNEQHKQGVDLNGEQGEDFFTVRTPQAYGNTNNSAEVASIEFDTANIDQLRATDYTVRFEGTPAEPVVTRNDNGSVVENAVWDADEETLSFGGVTMTFDGDLESGDRFEVQPVRRAGAGMEANIGDLDKIAAGSFDIAIGLSSDMDISGLQVSGANAFANSEPPLEFSLDNSGVLTIENFNGATIQVNGETRSINGAGVVVDENDDPLVITEESVITIDGVSFTINEIGDSTLSLSQATTASGDNRNALALQNLQAESIVGGNASFSGAYGAMVSDVGNRTNITQVNLDARQGLTDQLRAVQQSESGVNLDEEAANLIRFQQFYQANARVIDTASNIFDTILGLRS
ncbi:flagellar hook-associated protein FlgK [Halomonas sp. 7T]|uniref:flagellar hook-associated protein FlgK n=1 Tax=Halomonas sp. 7T TaxID=2893469 RepID=UPI0021D999B8|nr:flagellar hook-associated protein FlgK [Halomonas sp. 7T]UXZ53825.1 flagellar hook-associated protein FlgK [Halomonas sp. 7T]